MTEAAFPDRSWWVMAYVGVALLVVSLRTPSVPVGAMSALAFGLGLLLPHLWWANVAVSHPIGWLALSAAQAGAIGLFGAAVVAVRRSPVVADRPRLDCVIVPVSWVAVEHLRGRVPSGGFSWGYLA